MSDREKVYRWSSPLDWLSEASKEWDAERLASELYALASRLDSDQLQDEYQAEMDDDGYFAPVQS